MANDIRVYTLDEVADIIGVSKRTIYNYIKAGQIKAVKIGRAWRVTDKALGDFLEQGTDQRYKAFIYEQAAAKSQKSKAKV